MSVLVTFLSPVCLSIVYSLSLAIDVADSNSELAYQQHHSTLVMSQSLSSHRRRLSIINTSIMTNITI